MRVLLTTHAFLPRSVAGVEVYTTRLAAALQELGHVVAVLTAVHDLSRAPGSLRRGRVDRTEVYELNNTHARGTIGASCGTPELDAGIRDAVADFQPDVIHAQHFLNLSLTLVDEAHARGAPALYTIHDYWLGCLRDGLRMRRDGSLCETLDHRVCASCLEGSPYLIPPLQHRLAGILRRTGLGRLPQALHARAPGLTTKLLDLLRTHSPRAHEDRVAALDLRASRLAQAVEGLAAVLAPTRFAFERALEWGVPRRLLRLEPLGAIDVVPQPRPTGPRRRLGYVGTIAPHKGVHVLIEAVRGIPCPELTLDIYGNGALDPGYTRALEALARHDRRIRFRGAVLPGAPDRPWGSLDALVLPSLWWENSPLSVLEALAAGLPVVASRTGGVPEILPEDGGVLVSPGDVGALRDTLTRVVEGRLLERPLAPLPMRSALDGARELAALYSVLRRSGPS